MRKAIGIGAVLLAASLLSLGCGQSEDSLVVAALEKLAAVLEAASGESEEADVESDAEAEPEDPNAAILARLAELEAEGPDLAAGKRRSVVIEGGEFSSVAEEAAQPAAVPIYRYTDENGVVRMVQGKHAVPARFRASARNVSPSSMPVINVYEAQGAPTRREIAYQPPYNPNRSEVLLYSAEWCGACRKAKAFLDREGVSYELLDIDRDPRAKAEVKRVLGRVSIPLIDIDGTYIRGFAPDQIRRALRKS